MQIRILKHEKGKQCPRVWTIPVVLLSKLEKERNEWE
jgi:hypothetical protein